MSIQAAFFKEMFQKCALINGQFEEFIPDKNLKSKRSNFS